MLQSEFSLLSTSTSFLLFCTHIPVMSTTNTYSRSGISTHRTICVWTYVTCILFHVCIPSPEPLGYWLWTIMYPNWVKSTHLPIVSTQHFLKCMQPWLCQLKRVRECFLTIMVINTNYFLFIYFTLTHECLLRKQTGRILLSCCLSFYVTGRDCQLRMCITIAALTIGGTMWCLSPSVSTVRMTFISFHTATLTPIPVCNITWPASSAEISITCSESSWALAWLVTACLHICFTAHLCSVLGGFVIFLLC